MPLHLTLSYRGYDVEMLTRMGNVLFSALLLAGLAQADDLARAEHLYKHTDFGGSLALLNKHSSDGPTNFLIGRNYFMTGDFKKATEYIQKATTLEPRNAEYLDWLGRTYGK